MAESWICNASPLIALSQIGRLDLIAALADRVLVPATVIAEVAAGGQGNDADDQVRESHLVEVIADVAVPERVANWRLDAGETQVLARMRSPGPARGWFSTTGRRAAAHDSWPFR